eukprot:1190465-Prorocentrum_minimum.AAC.3
MWRAGVSGNIGQFPLAGEGCFAASSDRQVRADAPAWLLPEGLRRPITEPSAEYSALKTNRRAVSRTFRSAPSAETRSDAHLWTSTTKHNR